MSGFRRACMRKSTAAGGLSDRHRTCTGGTLRPDGCGLTVRSGRVRLPARTSPPQTCAHPTPGQSRSWRARTRGSSSPAGPRRCRTSSAIRTATRSSSSTQVAGDFWVAKLNVRDFRPVISPRYHLPPSVHVTFQAGGMLISTFVPRPLESDPQAQRVPFYHRNMDYDEVLFYHRGSFFSRAGIKSGMLTLHPQGIHHGPQPQAVEASKNKSQTDEVAVMVESRRSFTVLPVLEPVELKDYALSWSNP